MKRLGVFVVAALLGMTLAWGETAVRRSAADEVASFGIRFAESERSRCPEAWQLDHGTRLFFGYAQGVGCKAMLDVWRETGDDDWLQYVVTWADSLIADDGAIHLYTPETYNLDFVNSGKVLFDVLKATGDEKYRRAMKVLIKQLTNHPRTCDGGYWHKLCYQHQMWLDGIYMASPFMAQYGATFSQEEWIDEAARQVTLCHDHTFDPATGLYHHAWDESRRQRWADPQTGCSPCFWGRSIGWYFMALVDCLDFIPKDHEGYGRIVGYIRSLAEVLPRYADEDGLWYQVIDCRQREGNYAEASVTSQFFYAYAKAVNKGYLDASYLAVAQKAYEGLKKRLIVENADGTLSMTQCCAVGGLGGNPYRDGSYDYYIHEKIRDNDAKATGPFIMGCLQLAKALR